jgi:NTP pyrophosphatase (non-canonical NTP hydrolase)
MDNKSYQEWALTKERKGYDKVAERIATGSTGQLLHGAIGLSGESGELLDAVKKHILYGKELDRVNILEESGDALWYLSLVLESVGSNFSEVMQLNQDKLEKRYPGGFTEALAQMRLDKKETGETK